MTTNTATDTSEARIEGMLHTALAATAGPYLQDPSVIELMLNDDGKLWIDRLGEGRSYTGLTISPKEAERAIFIVASSVNAVCSKDAPILSAELPSSGFRFQGMLPPIVTRPIFSIRKKAIKVFLLSDYVKAGILLESQATRLKKAVFQKENILIAGGTGSGKTTLANAILAEIALTEERIVILEDTIELQCKALDSVSLRTKDGVADMTALLKATLRLRPDRIVIGEVRGKEALALLKSWNTGHPGGCATIHADSAARALSRLEQLIEEAGVPPSKALIAEAVNLIVYIEKTKTSRTVKEILQVSFGGGEYRLSAAQ
jgi:type IV secretion system protein VirB11